MGLNASPGPELVEGRDYVRSDSSVVVYRNPSSHPLLRGTDLRHPDFQRKLAETYARGRVAGLPRICSENSEDARTWHCFSTLLTDAGRRRSFLRQFLETALGARPSWASAEALASAELGFWWGRDAGVLQYPPPPSLPSREGNTEVDLTILIPGTALVFVEAKWQSGLSRTTRSHRDQACRNVDVGTWHAKKLGLPHFVFVLLTLEESPPLELRRLQEARGLQACLAHRDDLTEVELDALGRNIGRLGWAELPPHD